MPQGLRHVTEAAHVFQAFGRLRFLEAGKHLAYLTQGCHISHAHGACNALGGAKQIAQHWDVVAGRVFKQQGRATRAQGLVTERGHLQVR